MVEQSVTYLKQSSSSAHVRKQAWNIIKTCLVASLSLSGSGSNLYEQLCSTSMSLGQPTKQDSKSSKPCLDRIVFQNTIEGLFVAASVKDIQSDAAPFMEQFVCHLSLLMQWCGQQSVTESVMDGYVLIDAIATSIGAEEKDLSRTAERALSLLMDTVVSVLGSTGAVCQLPLMEVLVDKLCVNCYKQAWYTKAGG